MENRVWLVTRKSSTAETDEEMGELLGVGATLRAAEKIRADDEEQTRAAGYRLAEPTITECALAEACD